MYQILSVYNCRKLPELSVCLWFLHRWISEGAPAVCSRRWCWCQWSLRWCWGWWCWHWRPHCPAPSPWGASTCLCLIHGYCRTFTLPTNWETNNRNSVWGQQIFILLSVCFNMLFWKWIMRQSLSSVYNIIQSIFVYNGPQNLQSKKLLFCISSERLSREMHINFSIFILWWMSKYINLECIAFDLHNA